MLGSLGRRAGVGGPGTVFCDVYTKKLWSRGCSMRSCQGGTFRSHLLCFVNVQRQIVVLAPVRQLFHHLSVGCFIVAADETHYWKLNDVVCAGSRGAVMGQQHKQQGAEHTALGDAGVQHDCTRAVAAADPY